MFHFKRYKAVRLRAIGSTERAEAWFKNKGIGKFLQQQRIDLVTIWIFVTDRCHRFDARNRRRANTADNIIECDGSRREGVGANAKLRVTSSMLPYSASAGDP